jgi:phosphatidylglycerophosphate synthase
MTNIKKNKLDSSRMSIGDLKEVMFDYELKKFPYLKNFSSNPYTYLKARYYMYSSVFLVFFLIRTRITPNVVTIIYIVSGIATGILLSTPNIYLNYIALFIAFNKGILDWSDGHLARIKFSPSLTGHLLDEFGASINIIGFYVGIGFFAFHQTGFEFLIYLIPMMIFFNGEQYTTSASVSMINSLSKIMKSNRVKTNANNIDLAKKNKVNRYPKWISKFGTLFDGRARSTDTMILLVLLDITIATNFSLYLFLFIFIALMIRFFLSLILGVKRKWAEQVISNL